MATLTPFIFIDMKKKVRKKKYHVKDKSDVLMKGTVLHVYISENLRKQMEYTMQNGGFYTGGKKTYSSFVRYCIQHIGDNKEINLSQDDHKKIDELIKAIADNRRPLDEGLQDVKRLVDEIRAVGVNINQAVKKINYLEWIAEHDPNEKKTLEQRCDDLISICSDLRSIVMKGYETQSGQKFYSMSDYYKKASKLLEPTIELIEEVLRREDDILCRLII